MHAVCVVATSLERGLPVGLRRERRAAAALGPRDPLRPHAAGGPARARVGGDPAAVPAGRGDRAAGRGRALRRRRDAAERADRARAGARRRARDRRRLRAARRRERAGADGRAAAAGRRRRQRARRPAARPGRPRRAPDARGQRVLRRAPDDRHLARRPRLPRGARPPAVPPDLLRARRAVAAGRDRRAGRGRSSRSATAACAACARPTSRCSRGCSAAAAPPSRGELLSFILFDEVFIERLLQAGRADAERWLAAHPGFWSADAAAAGFEAPDVSPEAIALDEFRALRRR